MSSPNVKQEARRLVDNLPENATWDDLMYEIYVWQAIEAGPGAFSFGMGVA